MSYDPSRILYAHHACGTFPCSCVWDHPPLAIVTLHCWSCPLTFPVFTQLAEHHLKEHERPLPAALDVAVTFWEPEPRLVPFVPAIRGGV